MAETERSQGRKGTYPTHSHHVERDSDPGKELVGEVDNYKGENRTNVVMDMVRDEAKETQVIYICFIIVAGVN